MVGLVNTCLAMGLAVDTERSTKLQGAELESDSLDKENKAWWFHLSGGQKVEGARSEVGFSKFFSSTKRSGLFCPADGAGGQ